MDARRRTTMKVAVLCLVVLLVTAVSAFAGDTPTGPVPCSIWGALGDLAVFLILVELGWNTFLW